MTRPPKLPRRRLLLAAGGLLAAGLAQAQADAPVEPGFVRRPWPRGVATPPLDLAGFDGPRWRLAEARGQVVLLNFWAGWCEPCRSEMPALELLAQRFEREGLIVQAVNYRETDAAIRRFLQAMPITLNILRDADGATSRAWGARVFPSTVLVGRDGRAAFSVIGAPDWSSAEARQWLAPLLLLSPSSKS